MLAYYSSFHICSWQIRTLKQNIESLINVGDKTIEEVINDAHEKGICLIDEKVERFCEEREYIYNRVKNVRYSQFQKLYDYFRLFYCPF